MREEIELEIEVLIDEPHAKVSVCLTHNLGIIIWKGHCLPHQYREAFNTLLAYQEKHAIHPTYFISDIRNQGFISADERNWFEIYALPKARKNGMKRAVTVLSGSVLKQYYINLISATTQNFGFPFRAFKNWDKAVKWLLEDPDITLDIDLFK